MDNKPTLIKQVSLKNFRLTLWLNISVKYYCTFKKIHPWDVLCFDCSHKSIIVNINWPSLQKKQLQKNNKKNPNNKNTYCYL